jgi:hypothetical protein
VRLACISTTRIATMRRMQATWAVISEVYVSLAGLGVAALHPLGHASGPSRCSHRVYCLRVSRAESRSFALFWAAFAVAAAPAAPTAQTWLAATAVRVGWIAGAAGPPVNATIENQREQLQSMLQQYA